MKVAIIYSWYPPLPKGREDGGADYVRRFAENLARGGCEVHVLTSHPQLGGSAAGPASTTAGPFIHRIVSEWGLRGIWTGDYDRVRSALAEIAPDVINVVFPGAKLRSRYALPCLVEWLCPGTPLVTTLFHLMHPKSLWNPVYLVLVLVLYLSSQKICFQDEKHRALFQTLLPFLRRRCVFIPCGCNIEISQKYSLAASRRMRERLGLSPDYRYVSFYGFWYPSKNVHVLVEAVARLVQKGRKVKLLFVGGRAKEHITSAYGRRVLQRVAELNLWPAVILTGYCSDEMLNNYLLGSDLCVLPFSDRTMGRGTLFEAMELGVPLVSTRTADAGFLQHGQNIWLVDSPSVDELEAAIERVLQDDGLRARLGKGARVAAQEVTWPRLIRRWETLFEDTVAQPVNQARALRA